MHAPIAYLFNGQTIATADVPLVPMAQLRQGVIELVAGGGHLSAFFAVGAEECFRMHAVVCVPQREQLAVLAADVSGDYPALTPECWPANWFEREIYEQTGIRPTAHRWLKPIRFQPRGRRAAVAAVAAVGDLDFFSMQGAEVHEVAVGPVHAGVIEPGHFRFQCHGETVHHLEISLGYQHRGIERAMAGGPDRRSLHYMQTLAGDSTIGHSGAYCAVMEALGEIQIPRAAETVRAAAAELERMANHIGDLGAMAGDVGFLPTLNYCGRIRGDVLNLTALICGNRFGRGLLSPGGVRFGLDEERRRKLLQGLASVQKDLGSALALMFDTPSVVARLEGTGVLSTDLARRIGLVGPAARACGLLNDVRSQLPYGAYRFDIVPAAAYPSGDCFARAYVRWLELDQSLAFIRRQLAAPGLEDGLLKPCPPPLPDRMVVALTEGFRGEICHVAATDRNGRFAFYKVIDPSFHNWFGLAQALRGQQISDFPLCNKSFNLSYCGHDQ
ncbi:MAG: hydrogenase [Desulfobacteraceae bacterium]|nr:MAG: hydrogenase [Desulfobacteraceae bacterium]